MSPRCCHHQWVGQTDTDVVGAAIAYRLSRAIAAAADLDLASALRDGPVAIEDLAGSLQADVRGLRLLVRALVSEGVFSMPQPDVAALNDAARALLPRADGGQREVFLGWYTHPALYLGLAELAEGIRSGRPAFEVGQGVGFFDWLRARPTESQRYQAAVGGEDPDEFSGMLDLFDLSAHRVIADIGGGGGGLLRAAVKRWPHLRGMLIELPDVAEATAHKLRRAGCADQIQCYAADCVDTVPAGADVYVMTTVLRYFPDDQARLVLSNVHDALAQVPPPRTLLLSEMPADDGAPQSPAAIKSLLEYALTGGEDRSNDELRRLLERTGFTGVQHQHWEGPYWITSATVT